VAEHAVVAGDDAVATGDEALVALARRLQSAAL
jgi:hypothetical protein